MTDEKTNNKLIIIILSVVICIAATTLIYENIPKDNTNKTLNGNKNPEQNKSEIILTLKFKDQELKYTLLDLENLEIYTNNATMIKTGWLPTIKTEGPNQYTGIKISTLLNQIENIPENYIINVTSSDGESTIYNISQILGYVDIYNESSIPIYENDSVMILAYKIDGEYFIQEDTLPLRIVFCSENMTSSKLWAKMINSIVIIEQ